MLKNSVPPRFLPLLVPLILLFFSFPLQATTNHRDLTQLLDKTEELDADSREFHDQALKAKQLAVQSGDKFSEGRALLLLGVHALFQKEYENGAAFFSQAWQALQETQYFPEQRKTRARIAEYLYYQYLESGEMDRLVSFLDQAQKGAFQTDDPGYRGDMINLQAVYHYSIGNYYLAAHLFEEAMEYYRKSGKGKSGEGENLAKVLFNLGLVYKRQSNFDQSAAFLLEAAEYFRQNELYKEQGKCLNTLGAVFRELKAPEKGLPYQEEALDIFRQLNDSVRIASTLNSMGLTLKELGQPEKGLSLLKEALEIKKRLSSPKQISATLNNIGIVFQSINVDSALIYYNQAEALKLQVSDQYGLAILYNNMADAYLGKKDFSRAESYLRKARELAEKLPARTTLLENFELSKKKAIAADNLQEALRFSEQHDSLNLAIYQIEARKETEQLEARFQNKKKQQALLVKDAELKLKQEQLLSEQRIRQYLYVVQGISILALILLYFFFRQRQRNQKLKAEKSSIAMQLEAEENERQRIAADIHDEVGGVLSASSNILNMLSEDHPQIPLLSKVHQQIFAAYHSIRLTSNQLASYELFERNLVEGLQEFFDSLLESKSLRTEFRHSGPDGISSMPRLIQLLIFRSIQELTNNVLRHAKATHLRVELTRHQTHVEAKLADNGIGMDPANSKGLGLSNLNARITQYRGKLQIDSEKNQGTKILISIPLK